MPFLKILPPIWFFLFFLVALIAHFVFPVTRVFDISNPIWSPVIGAVCVVAGFALSLRASNIFAREKTEILPTSLTNRVLITEGPFQISRNPMYLGMVIILLGATIWLGSLPMFLAAVAHFTVLNFIFIPFEEAKMARQFGEKYDVYKRAVRRWL